MCDRSGLEDCRVKRAIFNNFGFLQVVSGKSGKLIWSLSLPDDWLTSSLSVIQAENGLTLAVLGLEARYALIDHLRHDNRGSLLSLHMCEAGPRCRCHIQEC